MHDPQLWQRIKDFKLDHEGVAFSFSQRVARDNGWSHQYALLAIEEYKKFIYLCCIDQVVITPSDEVDQVWHLHLTYTKSYWIDFCKNTLLKSIHHNPTKGGDVEGEKYSNCYNSTFDIYQQEFGVAPPEEFWPPNKQRFRNVNFERVNLSEYWMIKKPKLTPTTLILPLSLVTVVLFMQSDNDVPWMGLIIGIITILFVIRGIKSGGGGSRGGGSSGDSSSGFWGGFFGCSSDHSGCSSHGCGSGCGGCSGCSS